MFRKFFARFGRRRTAVSLSQLFPPHNHDGGCPRCTIVSDTMDKFYAHLMACGATADEVCYMAIKQATALGMETNNVPAVVAALDEIQAEYTLPPGAVFH